MQLPLTATIETLNNITMFLLNSVLSFINTVLNLEYILYVTISHNNNCGILFANKTTSKHDTHDKCCCFMATFAYIDMLNEPSELYKSNVWRWSVTSDASSFRHIITHVC